MKQFLDINQNPLLFSLEKIHKALCCSKIDLNNINETVDTIKDDLCLIANHMNLNKNEAFIYSICFNLFYDGNEVTIKGIANYLQASQTMLFNFNKAFESLVNKDILIIEYHQGRKRGYEEYIISEKSKKSIIDQTPFNNIKNEEIFPDIYELFTKITDLFDNRISNLKEFDLKKETILRYMKAYKNHSFAKGLIELKCETINWFIFLGACMEQTDDDDLDVERYLHKITSISPLIHSTLQTFRNNTNELLVKELVTFTSEIADMNIKPTETTISKYLCDFPMTDKKKITGNNKFFTETLPENIILQNLYYNPEEAESIATLTQLLMPNKFDSIVKNMKAKGLKSGFTIMFYGNESGTGKSSSVFNIAKQTNRAVLSVNLSDIKDMFVGNSEKNTKKIFSTYNQLKKNNYYENIPIMLIDECSGIIGKRTSDLTSPISNLLNNIVEIFLSNIELMDEAIIILTTNLKNNIDYAMERRILYKVLFNKASEDVRSKIIQNLLPLKKSEAKSLAKKYNINGGNIMNVKRKYEIYQLLNDNQCTNEQIERWCAEELSDLKTTNKMGFQINS